jgi:hypothetical protein
VNTKSIIRNLACRIWKRRHGLSLKSSTLSLGRRVNKLQ